MLRNIASRSNHYEQTRKMHVILGKIGLNKMNVNCFYILLSKIKCSLWTN